MSGIDGAQEFDFDADTFSSTAVIERLAYLELTEPIDREPEEQDELDDLYAFAESAESVPDWRHGETFINEDYFEDYAREMAEDTGAIQPDAAWPNSYIDWEAAADALQMDYTSFELRGTTYYAR